MSRVAALVAACLVAAQWGGCLADVTDSPGLRATAEHLLRLNQDSDDASQLSELDDLIAERSRLREREEKLTSKIDSLRDDLRQAAPEDSKDTHNGEIDKRTWPWQTFAACGVLVLLAWAYYARGLLLSETRSYKLLEQAKEGTKAANIAAIILYVLYWFIMPVTLFGMSLRSTCENGATTDTYLVYGLFLVACSGCACVVCHGYSELLPGGITLALSIVFAILENFDMASDVLFPGTALACGTSFDAKWLESWRQVPLVGHFLADLFAHMGFGGFSLISFIIGTYVPQLLGLVSIAVPFFLLLTGAAVVIWITMGWMAGSVAVVAMVAAMYWVEYLSKGSVFETHENYVLSKGAPVIAFAGGLLAFESHVDEAMNSTGYIGPLRMIVSGMTKLIFENLWQLGIQISFLSLSFDVTDDEAKKKALASILIGLFVFLTKIVAVRHVPWMRLIEYRDPFGALYMVIGVVVPCVTFVVLVIKLVFTFKCGSHVWNVTSGCVN